MTAGPGNMMGVAERDRGEEELSAKPSWRGGPTGNGHDRVVTVVKDGARLSGIMLRLTVF